MKSYHVLLICLLLAPSVKADQKYFFDQSTNTCVDSQGKQGLNEGFFGECGKVTDQVFKFVEKTKVSLRGLVLERVSFDGFSLYDVDLSYAKFKQINLGSHSSFSLVRFDSATLEKLLVPGGIQINRCSFKTALVSDIMGSSIRINESDFRGSKLVGKGMFSSLTNSDIRDSDFSGTNQYIAQKLDGTRFNSKTLLPPNFNRDYAVNSKKMVFEQ
jgi:uncharacterized protein YjbI with pentapeptide repeats